MNREMDALAGLSHTSTAVGYAIAAGGLGLAIGGHVLGHPWNRQRGNRFEATFHKTGIVVAGVAIAWALFAAGADSVAAASHRRDARRYP